MEKILQGGISVCVEPYMKAGENSKVCFERFCINRNPVYTCIILLLGYSEADPAGQCYLYQAGSVPYAICLGCETSVQ